MAADTTREERLLAIIEHKTLEEHTAVELIEAEITKAEHISFKKGWDIGARDMQLLLLDELEEVINQPHSTYEILDFMRAKRKELK